MRATSVRRLRVLCGILALVAVVVAAFLMPRRQFVAGKTSEAKGYHLRFTKITQGTNHVIFSGSSVLAKFKQQLYQSPLRPICRAIPRSIRAHFHSQRTHTNTTVFWVGWTHKDYSYAVTNGIPYSTKSDIGMLRCSVSEPSGRSSQLKFLTHSEAPYIKEFVGAWQMPAELTNWPGCTVHLREYGGQQDVATMQSQ